MKYLERKDATKEFADLKEQNISGPKWLGPKMKIQHLLWRANHNSFGTGVWSICRNAYTAHHVTISQE